MLTVYVCDPAEALHEGKDCEKVSDRVPESEFPDPNVPVIEYDVDPLVEKENEPLETLSGAVNVVVVLPVTVHPPVALQPNDTCVMALLATTNVIVLSWEVLPVQVPSKRLRKM